METIQNHTRDLKLEALRGISFTGLAVVPFVAFLSFNLGDFKLGILQSIFWLILLANLFLIERAYDIRVPTLIILVPSFALLVYIVIDGNLDLIYWIFVFPMISFFMLSLSAGIYLNLLFAIILAFTLYSFSIKTELTRVGVLTVFVSYTTITIVAYFIEKYRTRILKKLQNSIFTDFLTGVGNRRSFQENLEKQLNLFHRHKRPFSLMIFDADKFKEINDSFGHPAGDRVLIDLVDLTLSILRNEDQVYRVGGEEFAIILPETPGNGALIIADRIRVGVATHLFENDITMTISAGLAEAFEGAKVEDLFQAADRALYKAKKSGRNRVEIQND